MTTDTGRIGFADTLRSSWKQLLACVLIGALVLVGLVTLAALVQELRVVVWSTGLSTPHLLRSDTMTHDYLVAFRPLAKTVSPSRKVGNLVSRVRSAARRMMPCSEYLCVVRNFEQLCAMDASMTAIERQGHIERLRSNLEKLRVATLPVPSLGPKGGTKPAGLLKLFAAPIQFFGTLISGIFFKTMCPDTHDSEGLRKLEVLMHLSQETLHQRLLGRLARYETTRVS